MAESLVIELKEGSGGGGGRGNPPPGGGASTPSMGDMFQGAAASTEEVRAQQFRLAQLTVENDQQRRLAMMRDQKIRLEVQWLRLNQMGTASPVEMVKQQELQVMRQRVAIAEQEVRLRTGLVEQSLKQELDLSRQRQKQAVEEMQVKSRMGWVQQSVAAEMEYSEARKKFADSLNDERKKQQQAAVRRSYEEDVRRGREARVSVVPYLETEAAKARFGQAGQSYMSQAAGGGQLGQLASGALAGVPGGPAVMGLFAAVEEAKNRVAEEVRKSIQAAGMRSQAIAGLDPERFGQYADDAIGQMGLLGGAFVDLRKQAVAVSDAYLQTARKLSMYEGTLAASQAQAEVRGITGDIRRAQMLGPELARFVDAQSRAQETQKDILARFAKDQAASDAAIQEFWAQLLEKVDYVVAVLLRQQQKKKEGDSSILNEILAARNTTVPLFTPPVAGQSFFSGPPRAIP